MTKKILRIISSPRGEASVSIKLGNAVIEQIKAKYPDSVVKERNLAKNFFPYLEEVHIASFYTPVENHSTEHTEAIKHSDEAIAELQEADIIVIDVPVYNFSIPAVLKSYIDHIARRGVTFRYSENGPEGLLKNKKAYIAFAANGVYSEGAYQAFDFSTPYLKFFLGFLGITDVTTFRVEGLGIPNVKETAFEKGVESIAIA